MEDSEDEHNKVEDQVFDARLVCEENEKKRVEKNTDKKSGKEQKADIYTQFNWNQII